MKRNIPLGMMIVMDIAIVGLIVGGIYFFKTRPVEIVSNVQVSEQENKVVKLSGLPKEIPEAHIEGGKTTLLQEYESKTAKIRLDKVERGENYEKSTFYIAQIYVTDANMIKTAFAGGAYGKNLFDDPDKMAAENNAVIAINGDYYGGSDSGVVIRNGVCYRTDPAGFDVCVLFKDGTMRNYSPEEFNADTVMEQGAWQAWTFGPALLDGNGNMLAEYNTEAYIKDDTHPRCAIGYVSPGHYVFIVEDGRQEGYSIGITLDDMAQVLQQQGCLSGYNLDGGKSVVMEWNGEKANHPDHGGRELSDIIYVPAE